MHFDRLYQLHTCLRRSRYPVPLERLLDELQCSRATFKRLKEELVDRYGAPLIYDRRARGYRYDDSRYGGDVGGQPFELPGLWLNRQELYALLVIEQQLQALQHGLVSDVLKPLRDRVQHLLRHAARSEETDYSRIRLLPQGQRPVDARVFGLVAEAVMRHRKLHIQYFHRARKSRDERTLSPQRLVYYHDNWYLDAWCHQRHALRTFALDAMEKVVLLEEESAELVADAQLDQELASSYGIFAGVATDEAHLLFSAGVSDWVRSMQWHPQQQQRWQSDGSLLLVVPYANPIELIMDILKWGDAVQVLAPENLRRRVRETLQSAVEKYR